MENSIMKLANLHVDADQSEIPVGSRNRLPQNSSESMGEKLVNYKVFRLPQNLNDE